MSDRFLSRLPFVALLLVLALPRPGLPYMSVCREEVNEYCGDVEPGHGRLTDCVQHHQARFTAVCRTEVHAMIEQRPRVRQFCRQNAKELCSGIEAGKGRLYACLKLNQERLAPSCSKQLE